GSARNALRMMGTTRLRVTCMSPPTVSVTPTTDHARVGASAQTPTYTTPVVKTRAHDDGGDSGRRAVDRDVSRDKRLTIYPHLYHRFSAPARAVRAHVVFQSETIRPAARSQLSEPAITERRLVSFGSHPRALAWRAWFRLS